MVELGFNLLVFTLFVIGVLHLVFRFPEKKAQADRAVAALAAISNEIEDMITSRGNLIISEEPSKVDLIRTRYEAIAENIPSNSDREFIRAKRDLSQKDSRRAVFRIDPIRLFDSTEQETLVSSIALGSRLIVDVLVAIREVNEELYLGGSLVRNAVWDTLHGYSTGTLNEDVDVIYFEHLAIEKWRDEKIDQELGAKIPNIKWSTKNQARMNVFNHELPYSSLEEAISRWPETATAFVVRLKRSGELEFIAPYGFDDLLRMIITNTTPFENRHETIWKRVEQKRWLVIWPRLRVILPPQQDDGVSTREHGRKAR